MTHEHVSHRKQAWRALRLFFLLVAIPATNAIAQQMLLDTFEPAPDGPIQTFAVQDDGMWLAGGRFTRIADTPRASLARFHPDGKLDAGFVPDSIDKTVFSIAPLPDGKIMIAGNFTRIGGVARTGLARLHADGRLDTTFPDLRLVPLPEHIHDHTAYRVLRLSSGKLLVAGCFTDIADSGRKMLVRLHPDGRIDDSFKAITAQSINARAFLWDVREQADGRLLLAGGLGILHGVQVGNVARLHADGTLDTSFTPAVRRPGGGGEVRVALEQADRRIVLGGRFEQVIGSGQRWTTPYNAGNLVRLHADGSIDYSFSENGASADAGILWLALQPDQSVLIVGPFNHIGTSPSVLPQKRDRLARILGNGRPDPALAGHPTLDDGEGHIETVAHLPDGRIVIGGTFTRVNSEPRRHLARFSPAGPLRDIVSVTASDHTCAIDTRSTPQCWGDNRHGQLGDGGNARRVTPIRVEGPPIRARALTAGHAHTCALTDTGAVHCWGRNHSGQLGDGSADSRATPAPVAGLDSGIMAIAAGHAHTCALTTQGAVRCWGDNTHGQLGDGSAQAQARPAAVAGLDSGVAAITAGHSHTCALAAGGRAMCWGRNWQGELGDGSATQRSTPVPVADLGPGVRTIAAGYVHSCAIDAHGAAHCWGRNLDGQLGDGTHRSQPRPVAVTGLRPNQRSIHTGRFHTCALDESGTAHCWGNNRHGQLGDGSTTGRLAPTLVHGLGQTTAHLTTGQYHSCAVSREGLATCWGWNGTGQLGDGGFASRPVPAPALTPHSIAAQ